MGALNVGRQRPGDLEGSDEVRASLVIPLFAFLLPLVAGLFQLKGGLHMRDERSLTASMLGVVAALVPVSPLWLLSLPLGIWALVLLQREEVKAAFTDYDGGAYPAPGNPAAARGASTSPIVVMAIFLFVAAALASVALLFGFWGTGT